MPSPAIGLVRNGTLVTKGASWEVQQKTLDRCHGVVPKGFVHPSLLDNVRQLVKTQRFVNKDNRYPDGRTLAKELALDAQDPLSMFFRFLTNQEKLFAAVRELARCDADIQGFIGRGRKFLPGVHFDKWHNDDDEGRSVGLSINLQPAPVSGGEFQIRHLWSNEIHTFPMPEFGDAVLFRIGRLLFHRTLPAKGPVPRFTYAGWFLASRESGPRYRTLLREPPAGWAKGTVA